MLYGMNDPVEHGTPTRLDLFECALRYAVADTPASRADLTDAAFHHRHPTADLCPETLPEQYLEKVRTAVGARGDYSLGDAVHLLLDEVIASRACAARFEQVVASYDKWHADGANQTVYPSCAHCQAKFEPGELETVAAHVRQCGKNPMVQELAALRAEVESWKARAGKHGCNVGGGDPDCG